MKSKYARLLVSALCASMMLACLVVAGGCVSSPTAPGTTAAPLDPAKAIAAVSSTIDAAAAEVDTLQAAVAELQIALAAEANGTDQFKSIERELAQRQAELGTARVYLRFAQIFARAFTPPAPPATPPPATKPAG